jgi:hypothetical protein
MLIVIQHFGRHCTLHLQGECRGWAFWKPYIGQAVGGEKDLVVLIGGVEEH